MTTSTTTTRMRRSSRRLLLPLVAAMPIGIGLVQAASADMIQIASDGGASTEALGSFSGSLLWDYVGGPTGTLTVNLTNTNDLATGGFITAFTFNIDGVSPSASLSSSSNASFALITNVNAMPFGMSFDAGASTGGSFQGGGNPSVGIGAGQTGTFVFSIAASNVADLTTSSFIDGPAAHNFVVRFRGFLDGGSDKVPAKRVDSPIPGPGALAMLGIAGLLAGRRRRR